MDILNANDARRYLGYGPRRSLVKCAAQGVEMAAMIADRQGNGMMASDYRAAANILRNALGSSDWI